MLAGIARRPGGSGDAQCKQACNDPRKEMQEKTSGKLCIKTAGRSLKLAKMRVRADSYKMDPPRKIRIRRIQIWKPSIHWLPTVSCARWYRKNQIRCRHVAKPELRAGNICSEFENSWEVKQTRNFMTINPGLGSWTMNIQVRRTGCAHLNLVVNTTAHYAIP